MKLQELATRPSSRKINKVNESRFGFSIDYDKLTVPKARSLSTTLGENITRLKQSFGGHKAEKNPRYMELLMVREGLNRWIEENRPLTESEIAKSGAILAAKDIVDSFQDMLEDISKMQNEQLPALLDTIRDQLGTEQAEGFKNSVSPLLQDLASTLQQGRETADSAARTLAGEQTPEPMGMGGGMGGSPDMGGGMGGAPDMGGDMGDMGGDFGAVDAAAGGGEELGRERRGMSEAAKMTPKQKKFAALAKPENEITYADKIAGAKKSK